jgi:hypothetical protein
MIAIDLDSYTMNDPSRLWDYSTLQRKLLLEIIKVRNEYLSKNIFFDRLVMNNRMFNVIADTSSFSVSNINPDLIGEGLTKMGILAGLDVYINIELPSDVIQLSVEKSTARDMKIDSIIYDMELETCQVDLKIISSVI